MSFPDFSKVALDLDATGAGPDRATPGRAGNGTATRPPQPSRKLSPAPLPSSLGAGDAVSSLSATPVRPRAIASFASQAARAAASA